MPPLDSCAYPAAETHLSSPLWLVGAVRREGEREGERERGRREKGGREREGVNERMKDRREEQRE